MDMDTQEKINRLFFMIIKNHSKTEREQEFEKAGLSEDELRENFSQYMPAITKENFRFNVNLMTMNIEDVSFLSKTRRLKNILISADIFQVWQLYAWPQQHPLNSLPRNSESSFMWSFLRFRSSGNQLKIDLLKTLESLGLPVIDTVTFTYQEMELLESTAK